MQRRKELREPLQWDDVRLFLALCRARSVRNAAAALGVDSSTVSRRLVALEEALSTTLFARGRDGISPTEAAEGLMPVAEEIERGVLRFGDAADGLERKVEGLVRMTCPPDVAEVVIAPLLGELLTRHPALRVALDPGEAVLDLARREADLALRTVRPVRGDLVVTKVATAHWVVAATQEHARKLGSLRAWTDARWIGWGERFSGVGAARWLAERVRGVEPVVRSDSLRVQLCAVAAGVGVALVPEPSLAHYGLVPIRVHASLAADAARWPADDLFLVTHRALQDVPRIRAVWDLLVERLRDRPPRPRRRA